VIRNVPALRSALWSTLSGGAPPLVLRVFFLFFLLTPNIIYLRNRKKTTIDEIHRAYYNRLVGGKFYAVKTKGFTSKEEAWYSF
jgi:hypothetical protein